MTATATASRRAGKVGRRDPKGGMASDATPRRGLPLDPVGVKRGGTAWARVSWEAGNGRRKHTPAFLLRLTALPRTLEVGSILLFFSPGPFLFSSPSLGLTQRDPLSNLHNAKRFETQILQISPQPKRLILRFALSPALRRSATSKVLSW